MMPLWFLSGALFPASGAMGGLGWVMRANPLSYGLDGLRRSLHWGDATATAGLPGLGVCLGVSAASAAALFLLASRVVAARSAGQFE